MNKLRVATVAVSVPLILFVTSGVANASPGSGPVTPEWVPNWLYPVYYAVWGFFYQLQNGINPFNPGT
ncbi:MULTISPECIES: hypothetical protein [unclassified Rhodococcus (in: high G+C Gram-positive bacteria)]|uniref:hypothetical protein n=1 Tax=unclassified Rhodococcus (in: high G+C Gram-positive bacteria) TaxID=192944 RepID=UPI00109DFA2C|nr:MULTISPECIES: hypothetical protein [unclassified Rhodococcus (in: high G+C Gram-positive bacteria)]MDJ0362578.1 hypothetical protein [Rhodococcus sp. H29-C3]QCB49914.1 hypothetical protein E5769_06415 [Rhodococcus sp. PAMC28705]QCB58393.1 hypothetical protein E5720_07600 [Rhodococcus sp. PAMC28707]